MNKWKLVPVEPTEEIRSVIRNETCVYQSEDELYAAMLEAAPQPPSVPELEEYDAGALNDFGGGNVGWWQDYIRSELGRAYEFYCGQLSAAPTPAEAPADVARDAERLDWLDVQCSENNGRHIYCLPGGLRAAIDAAIERQGG